MGRKAKYNKELKLEIIKRYLNGESTSSLGSIYNIPIHNGSPVLNWVNKYKVLGESAFDESTTNKSYSSELKEKVIKEYLEGRASFEGLTNKYNITSITIVRRWVMQYNNGKEIKDYNPKSEVYTMKARKTTFEERLEIVNYVLANDNDYKGAADIYSVPYASIYQWVSKYNKCGEAGLSDRRGRPSTEPVKELTTEEKQALEIEKLKRELERKDMVIQVLKKTSKYKNEWKEILTC